MIKFQAHLGNRAKKISWRLVLLSTILVVCGVFVAGAAYVTAQLSKSFSVKANFEMTINDAPARKISEFDKMILSPTPIGPNTFKKIGPTITIRPTPKSARK